MFLLDTNIVSEVMRPEPDQRVIDWLNRYFSTCNVLDFLCCGLVIVNPFADTP